MPSLAHKSAASTLAVAVEVDEPLTVDKESDFLLAVAAEIAGDGNAVFQSAHPAVHFVPVGIEHNPVTFDGVLVGPRDDFNRDSR